MVELADIAEINPRLTVVPERAEPVSFVPMAYLDDVTAVARAESVRPYSEVAKGYTPMLNGDLLVAKITPCFENGKIGQAMLSTQIGMGSTEFHVVRPRQGVDSRYLLHFLRTPRVNAAGQLRMTGSGGQRRIPAAYLQELSLPLPPLDEQRRIGAILDRVSAMQEASYRAVAKSRELIDLHFQQRFGNPRHASGGTDSVVNIAAVQSGSTPSKSNAAYWQGDVPWFSPKDLKRNDLWDSINHVSAEVARQQLKVLPEDTVVMVVRGMILAHSVPVSTLRVPATINQDLKAFIPQGHLPADFLAAAIRVQRKQILADVESSAHGTKRLGHEALAAIRIPQVPRQEMDAFVAEAARLRHLTRGLEHRHERLLHLAASVQSRAFQGGL